MDATPQKKASQMKQQIATYLKKKDYYDILGLQKTCEQADIKKAYKRLALKFHPDKNQLQGSKQVFNKISNAYTNLIDPEKRKIYDQLGPEEDRQPRFRPQRQYRQGYTQDDQFQDIFRAFFGDFGGTGAYRNNQFQHYTFSMGSNRRGHNNQTNGSNLIYFFVFIFVLYILPSFFPRQQPLYSTSPSSNYRYSMKTSKLQVPYYVGEQFVKQNKNGQLKKQIEQLVDYQYYKNLKNQCSMFRTMNRGYYNAPQIGQKYQRSCKQVNLLEQKYLDYIQSLILGY